MSRKKYKAANEGPSLFDNKQGWEIFPVEAFVELLVGGAFSKTAREAPAHVPRRDPAKGEDESKKPAFSDESMAVYESMFRKYVEFLKGSDLSPACPRASSVLDARPDHIALYFDGSLGKASRAFAGRTLRLLERTYDCLVEREFVRSNPVSAWRMQFMAENAMRPEAAREGSDADDVGLAEIERVRSWLVGQAQAAWRASDYTTMRDCVMALLGLGAGLRSAEIIKLTRTQLSIYRSATAGRKVSLKIGQADTIRSAAIRNLWVDAECEDLLLAWIDLRWSHAFLESPIMKGRAPSKLLFVRTSDGHKKGKETDRLGQALSVSGIYRALDALAKKAEKGAVLCERSLWILSRGNEGLRRAYALSRLKASADPRVSAESRDLIRADLGLRLDASVKRYEREVGLGVPAAVLATIPSR